MEAATKKAVAGLTGYLNCTICYEVYKRPKYLSCYHSYCEECVVNLVRSQRKTNIICPQCKKTSPIPSLAWPDRFFPFFFGVAEKRVWSGLQSLLVLAPPTVVGVLMAVT